MTTPDPTTRPILPGINECGRLRIMDHNDVFVELHASPVLLAICQEDLLRLPRQFVWAAVKGVVKRLRHLEEVVPPTDGGPMRSDFQFVEPGNEPVHHLGDSSTHRCGI